jgi:hypothetical protein
MLFWSNLAAHLPQRPTYASIDLFQKNLGDKLKLRASCDQNYETTKDLIRHCTDISLEKYLLSCWSSLTIPLR